MGNSAGIIAVFAFPSKDAPRYAGVFPGFGLSGTVGPGSFTVFLGLREGKWTRNFSGAEAFALMACLFSPMSGILQPHMAIAHAEAPIRIESPVKSILSKKFNSQAYSASNFWAISDVNSDSKSKSACCSNASRMAPILKAGVGIGRRQSSWRWLCHIGSEGDMPLPIASYFVIIKAVPRPLNTLTSICTSVGQYQHCFRPVHCSQGFSYLLMCSILHWSSLVKGLS